MYLGKGLLAGYALLAFGLFWLANSLFFNGPAPDELESRKIVYRGEQILQIAGALFATFGGIIIVFSHIGE